MNEYIQRVRTILNDSNMVGFDFEVAVYGLQTLVTECYRQAYNRGVEDTKEQIAKWIDANTGAGGDVSYPDLMKFMAGTKDIDEAITKLLNK